MISLRLSSTGKMKARISIGTAKANSWRKALSSAMAKRRPESELLAAAKALNTPVLPL